MNAEFTEKKIVITEVDGKMVITPAKVRKGLDPKAFVGAMLCGPGTSALIVGAAKSGEKIDLVLIGGADWMHWILQYDPATGEFAMVPVNNGSTTGSGTH